MGYRIVRNEDELYHHGVKGMKWGVRRYQKEDGTLTNAGKERYSDDNSSKKQSRYDKLYSKYKDLGYSDEEAARTAKGRVTAERTLAIVGGVAVAAAVGYGAYKLKSKVDLSKLDVAGLIDKKSGLELQAKRESVQDTVKAVNPKFSMFNRKYSMNCGNCGIAFELRSRGYNVEASGNPTGMTISSIGQFFKGFKSESFREIDINTSKLASDITTRGKQVENIMKDNIRTQCSSSDGRGMMFFPATFGSHWVSWTKTGNDVNFHNSQNPSVDLTTQVFAHYKYHRNNGAAALTSIRLDDLDINTNNIHSVVTNVTKAAKQTAEKFDTFAIKGENFVTSLI